MCVACGGVLEIYALTAAVPAIVGLAKLIAGDKPRIEDVLADELEKYTGTRPEREFKFRSDRKWSFDLAYVDQRLAIEINGRHHLKHGAHRKDCEKINAAHAAGWTVLQYPASSVTTKSRRPAIVEQISRVLCGVHIPELDSDLLTGSIR